MKGLRSLLALGLAAGLVLSAGCQPQAAPTPEVPQEPLKVAVLKGPTALGLLPLLDNPSADPAPCTVEVLASPDLLVGRLASGELDFATVPTNLAAKLYGKNPAYSAIAMNTWGSMWIIGKDETVQSLEDLKGKTLYNTGKGTTPDVVLTYLLNAQGIDPDKDLTVDLTLPPVELAQAAAAGKVDLALLPEPFVTMVLGKNPDMKSLLDIQALYGAASDTQGTGIPQTCLVVRNDLLKERPEAVKAFMDRYRQAMESVIADPKTAGALSEKHGIIQPAALAEKAIPNSGIRFKTMKDARTEVEAYLKTLMAIAPDSIGGALPDEGFYITEY